MKMQLIQRSELKQMLSLSHQIRQSEMLKYRNLDGLLKGIAENPEVVEEIVNKLEYNTDRGTVEESNTLSTLAFLFNVEKNSNKENRGLIMDGGLGGLETIFDIENNDLSADVIYTVRENSEPELHFSDRLMIKPKLAIMQIPKKFKHANNIYNKLLIQHRWQAGMLREAYSLIGKKQMEFIQSLDELRFNKYDIEDLSEDLGLRSSSTTRRLLNGRVIAIDSPNREDVSYYRAMDLLKTNDKIGEIYVKNKLVKYILSEKGREVVLSDQQLCDELKLPAARRTITKYRNQLGIPTHLERKRIYMRK